MPIIVRRLFALTCLFVATCALPLRAQEQQQAAQGVPQAERPGIVVPSEDAPLTGKERLGRKWMDEQRQDNCNVPPDKRGPAPRPNCPDGAAR